MIEDYFAKKRVELGMDRADVLGAVQATLDEWYPGQTRAKRLHQGTLRVVTLSASVAADLRMRQVDLLARHDLSETRLAIGIGTLD
ncbi:MAG TPA: hypothetical protein VLF67_05390 [Candidatus Saccharimonas sp.]|nr:hypothetical protein [Candidatus Saccharimonas sp.]